MSVKFEKETIRDAPIPGARETDIAHKLGEKLTGGKSQTGYLAVSIPWCFVEIVHHPDGYPFYRHI